MGHNSWYVKLFKCEAGFFLVLNPILTFLLECLLEATRGNYSVVRYPCSYFSSLFYFEIIADRQLGSSQDNQLFVVGPGDFLDLIF
jgi:hypothetical protein